MRDKLTPATIKAIVTDWDLFSLVGKSAKIQPTSLYTAVRDSSKTVMQYSILQSIATYLKKDVKEIVIQSHSKNT